MSSIRTVDAYIRPFPKSVQALLKKMRATIASAAPKAEEAVKYGIPTFVLNGNLVHFGGYKTHIGFYPGPGAIVAFKKELAKYPQSKGAIRFSVDEPIPFALVKRIVAYRVKQNVAKPKAKGK